MMTRSCRTSSLLSATILALVLCPAPCGADAGELDPTFGVGGVVLSDYAGGRDWASALAVQSDGKLVVAGAVATGTTGSDMGVARFLADGTLDSTFGVSGWVTVDFSGADDTAYCVLILDDGRILVGGLTYRHWGLARLLPDGRLDPGFGTGGRVTVTHLGGVDWIRGLAVQPDGKILAGGMVDSRTSARYDFAVGRFHPDGTLDTTFGTAGRVTTDFFGSSDYGEGLVVQPDGSFVLAGRVARTAPPDVGMGLVRYTAAGALDVSFGAGGIATVDFGGNYDLAYDLVLQDDGGLVVVGQTGSPGWTDSALAVARLDPSGSPDPGFGSAGQVTIDLGGWFGYAFAGVVQPNGRIVVGGYRATDRTSQDGDFVLARLNPDGSTDVGFGDAGVAVTDLGGRDHGYALAVLPDGRVVAAGRQSPTGADADFDFAIVRYQTSPAEGIEGLIEIVEDLVDEGAVSPAGRGGAWLVVLRVVSRALERGNEQQAIRLLETFARQVESAIETGAISAADGAPLIDSALALIASIQG